MINLNLKNLKKITLFLAIYFIVPGVSVSAQSNKANIAFISVATEDEGYWGDIHSLAKAAAKDLGVNLEILLSNRDHIAAKEMAYEISNRKNKPDYAIVVGEKLIASGSIPILTKNGIKVFLFGSLTTEEKEIIGEPRQKYPNYIGKISINDYLAGYLTAEKMVKKAITSNLHDNNGFINFIALEGVHKTSFNSERVRGLNDILKKYPQVKVLQSVHTDWSYEDATRITPQILYRYSQSKIAGFWCANSELARGASDAMKSLGKKPGIDFITAGTDWGINAVQSTSRGDVLAIAGGHVTNAAWIVTLIHDYHNGVDLDSTVYLNKVTIMDKSLSNKFLKHFESGNWDIINFKRYSKVENSHLTQYELSFNSILNNL